ncbi:MAG TPA: hypothetical protein VFP00_04410, partial [Burkholderiales bacterium]|nr:hypothetical protein [Burkholderiales bacterium]
KERAELIWPMRLPPRYRFGSTDRAFYTMMQAASRTGPAARAAEAVQRLFVTLWTTKKGAFQTSGVEFIIWGLLIGPLHLSHEVRDRQAAS